jgi:hypothetical protein
MKKVLLASLALALSLGAFTTSEAGPGYHCPDVYDPVTCSNGQTYSNACYASLAGATGCVRGV